MTEKIHDSKSHESSHRIHNQSNGVFHQNGDIFAHDDDTRNYGSTRESTPLKPKKNVTHEPDINVITRINDNDTNGLCNNGLCNNGLLITHSRLTVPLTQNGHKLSDEVITEVGSVCTARSDFAKSEFKYDTKKSCWVRHPQVRSHWREFLAAFGLLIIGAALIIFGIIVTILPELGFQSYVFLIAGVICFIPGAYHVVYVYCAVKGRKGYDFYQLPLFN